MTESPLQSQHLLIDADDTLWENNIYFEQAFEDFVAFLNHEHLNRDEIQAILDEIELANRGPHGYGARAFARGLRETFARVANLPPNHPDADIAESFGLRILQQQFAMMDGVLPTIQALRGSHDLILLTKGHREEQEAKVERSGIAPLFTSVIIAEEKTVQTYLETVDALALDPAATWMVGNSPRSDINPALRAGINAVFIPHPRTWHLEVEEVLALDGDRGRLIRLERFSELISVFQPT